MKIGVTGGSGFIGTQLCHLLTAQGHEIVILDIAPSKDFPKARVNVDVRDYEAVKDALRGCEAVYHLAAEHQDNVEPLSKYYDVNVEGGKNVIKACEALGIQKILFTSTVALYGLNTPDAKESDEPEPFNDYGRSKWESEKTFRAWVEADAKRSLTVFRLVATFGAGNRGNVYNLLRQLASGSFVMIGSGQNHKSLAYVENVAAFLQFALGFGAGEHLYNYADKPDLNMQEMISSVRRSLGKEGSGISLPYPIGLVGGYCFDILSRVTGKKFPISSIRVKKFCADTVVNADKAHASGFTPPHDLRDGLEVTVKAEFGEKKGCCAGEHREAA